MNKPRAKLYTVQVYRWSRQKDKWVPCSKINPVLAALAYRSADAAARAGQHEINDLTEQAWEVGIDADARAWVVLRKGEPHSVPDFGQNEWLKQQLRGVAGFAGSAAVATSGE